MPYEATRRAKPSEFVGPTVVRLQEEFVADGSRARATLAQLRLAMDGEPGTAWGMSEYLMPPQNAFLEQDDATFDEVAIHIAVTAYAWLQQSNSARMHVRSRPLGDAVRRLSTHPTDAVDRGKAWARLAKLAQAESVAGLRWQLRGLLSLMRTRGIGLDIARLADDLYFWQFPSSRPQVQRRWSREFFAQSPAAS